MLRAVRGWRAIDRLTNNTHRDFYGCVWLEFSIFGIGLTFVEESLCNWDLFDIEFIIGILSPAMLLILFHVQVFFSTH